MADSYINYLLTKYFIFKNGVELDPGNAIENIKNLNIKIEKIKSDKEYIDLTKKILSEFLCFEIVTKIELCNRVLQDKAEDIFFHYKKYKCSGVRETETYLKLDETLDTSKTEWVESIDISTQFLVSKFGNYMRTGNENDRHRFEYKFEFIDKGKKWVFSLYDYLNTADEFDQEEDIYWHIASNTKKQEIISNFMETLKSCC